MTANNKVLGDAIGFRLKELHPQVAANRPLLSRRSSFRAPFGGRACFAGSVESSGVFKVSLIAKKAAPQMSGSGRDN